MWVGCNTWPVRGRGSRSWVILAVAAMLVAACSSDREKRAEAEANAAGEETGDVLAAFEAWANDGAEGAEDSGDAGASASNPGGASSSAPANSLDGVIQQFNRKVSACWKQPFGMPRLATVRLLVQFNPDGTIRNVTPRPEPAEAMLYRTKAPYLVMIAQTSSALRRCQPYEGIRANFARLSQLELVVDPRMFRN